MTIGQLSVMLGLTIDRESWKKGEAHIDHFRRLALAFGGYMSGKFLLKGMVGFNQTVEESKNQIAAMLSFAKQTSFNAELQNANILYDRLREKAMQLPGETEDYVKMLGMITQPLAAAGASLEDMEKFTVNSFVLSRALGETWQKSARDIREFVNFGKINMVDTFTRTVMKPLGYDADAKSRSKLKAMSAAERMKLMEGALSGPQIQQMIDAQSKSFAGRVDAVKGTLKQIMGKVGEGLFQSMKSSLEQTANWLQANRQRIEKWAKDVGEYIAGAFEGLQSGFQWLIDHQDVLVSFLVALGAWFVILAAKALIAWFAVAWPMFAGAGIFLMFTKLFRALGPLPTILIAIGIAAGLMWLGIGGPITVAIVAIAAFGAALYVWKGDVIEIFKEVERQATSLWDTMGKIPVIGSLWNAVRGTKNLIEGDFGDAAKYYGKSLDPTGVSSWDSSGLDMNDVMRKMSGEPSRPSNGANVIVQQGQQNITINTKDADGVKAAIGDKDQERQEAGLRTAKRVFSGNRPDEED